MLTREGQIRVKSRLTCRRAREVSGIRPRIVLRLTGRLILLVTLSLVVGVIHSVQAQTATLRGTVSVNGANGVGERLPLVSLKLSAATLSRIPLSTVTDDSGEYKFTDLDAGLYTLDVSLRGFQPHTKNITVLAGTAMVEVIHLDLEGVSGEVT